MDGDSEPVFAGQPPAAIGHLVRCWFPDACVRRPLAGGFSGGGVWLVEAAGGRFVLKVFPRGTSLERGRWIHAAMLRARAAGLAEVPAAVPAQDGDSLVASDGRLWEMVSFVDGQPASRPTAAQVAAALAALANVHRAGAQPTPRGESAAIRQRVAAARSMIVRPWAGLLAEASAPGLSPQQMAVRARLASAATLWSQRADCHWLAAVAGMECPVVSRQWVLRDIWCDHVLFAAAEPARVAGLIDYHASGFDTTATDVARLLGSWIDAGASQPTWWEAHLLPYEDVRPLPTRERRLIPFLAASSVVFGLNHWFHWTLEEGRQFGSTTQVTGRLDRLLEQLPTALDMLAGWAREPV